MKISIITVVYNREATIERAVNSVLSQSYSDIEYIVIDGGSSDRTLDILGNYKERIDHFVSEKDKGIYDAINKGIELSTGEIIGLLHSDDVFSSDKIIEEVVSHFQGDHLIDCIYGDVAFINPDKGNRVVRYYSSATFTPKKFLRGFMPAHTSFFCKKECFNSYGNYSLDYTISSDFDLLLRFLLIHKIKSKYVPLCITNMALGGESTAGFSVTFRINRQILKILKSNGISSNYFKLYSRYFEKIGEYF
ncbi:MAG: glycosyltransferase family 2 protein [Saprospiraceae bacterium]